MSFRYRIAAWAVVSCAALMGLMMFTAYRELEEELREGRWDHTHPKISGWVLHNSYAEDEIEDILGELMRTWFWTAVPVITLSLGAGLLLARRSLRPVHEVNRQLAAMRPDSLHGGITISEADPILADLVNQLNDMLDRAGAAYGEMAEFAARVAHELRTPLMLLRTRLEHAPVGIPPAFQEDLQDELARLSRFVERSLLAARAEQGALSPLIAPVCLSELVREVAEDYHLLADERGLEMSVEITADLWAQSNSDLLRQVLHGLLENATRYAANRIRVCCRAHDGERVVEIDNDVDSGNMATAGLGLGLRLVRGICRACGMTFESGQVGGGFFARLGCPVGEAKK